MQKITPFLWFDKDAEKAVKFYTSVFKNSKITGVLRCGAGGPGPEGSVLTMSFKIEGVEFTALNGGSNFNFTPATSFVVHCRTQKDVDYYWRKLSPGGKHLRCGWLTDKFGVTWQIVPDGFIDLLMNKNPAKAKRAMAAMMKMVKLDINKLKKAIQ